MSQELKTCPFCGAQFLISQEPHDNGWVAGKFYIYHDYGPLESAARKCRIEVPGHFDTREDAIAAWNTRASDARIAELEAEVEGLKAGPKVKQLEWSAGHSAASPCGTYYVIPVDGQFAVSLNAMTIAAEDLGRFGTLDHAKAAAQADYEARILSALVQP